MSADVLDFPAPDIHVDVEAAHRFLTTMYPLGPWLIHLIQVEGGVPDVVMVDPRGSADEGQGALSKALEKNRRGTHNAYFPVNPSRSVLSKKAEKDDIGHAGFLHCDIDPRAGEDVESERERIRDLIANRWPQAVPAATAVIDSGGGYWLFWRLAEPVALDGTTGEATAAVEARNKQIELLFQADACHNVDRVARLPGSVNHPKADKRRKGRVVALARVVEMQTGRAYSLDDFQPVRAASAVSAARSTVKIDGPVASLKDVDELDQWKVPDRVKVVIVQGRDEDRPKVNDNSRSAWVFDVCCQLVRAGVPDDVIFSVLTDPTFGISESVLEKGAKAKAYAVRQIEKARADVELDTGGWVETTKTGDPIKSFRNTVLALGRLGVECRHNRFRDRLFIDGEGLAGEISGQACVRLREVVIARFGFDPGKEHVNDAMEQIAFSNAFDPVVEYLDEAQGRWDGVARLDTWLTTYLGAPARPMEAAVGRAMLVAAVRRARRPGCKFDFITVLEGRQGSGKSTALRVLAGGDDVFSDAGLLHLDGKGQMEAVKGVWIFELGELAGLRAADVEKVKAFASRTHDRARGAYERHVTEQPRRCVFVGTTNRGDYLRDGTGNRRFWPVETGEIDLEALRRDRDQLWGEAAAVEAEGGPLGLPEGLWAEAAERQAERVEEEPWVDRLRDIPWHRHTHGQKRVTAEATYHHLEIGPKDRSPGVGRRVKAAMASLGWEGKVIKVDGRTVQGYVADMTEVELAAMAGAPKTREIF